MFTHIGEERFEKKCFLMMRKKLKVEGDYSKGLINIAVAFCVEDDETEEMVKKFRKDFLNKYIKSIDKTDNLMKLQYYDDKTPIYLQYYNSNIKKEEIKVPNYFITFNKEGYTLSTENVKIIYN